MKTLTHALPAAIFTALIFISSLSYADDTEIYFARAAADNSENKPKANVMIMLDTSGSMRNCETGTGADWCGTIKDRRITLLHDAMKQILDDTPPTVEIGLGRFVGSSGGRVLLPVMPVNDLTRSFFDDALNSINEGQNRTNPGNVQPSGGTPTAMAYQEMANYMLGKTKSSYATYTNTSYCVSNTPDERNCHQETQWSDPVEVPWCDASTEGCDAITRWSPISFCDVSSNNCQYTDWSDWRSAPSCTPSNTCETRRVLIFFTQYRSRSYEQMTTTYQGRQPNQIEVCNTVPGTCADSRSIIGSGNNYNSPINAANQCETNHIILFTDGAPSGDSPGSVSLVNCGNSSSYNCQKAIAQHLNSESNSKGVPIKTHNIGLYMGSSTLANMKTVSGAGGGETYDSNSAETLLEAFKSTLDLIDEDARSISAPGVAVNAMNRFQHLDQLFYSVFQPFESSYWEGNLKRYQLVNGEIHGVNGLATDPATGYFRSSSQSYWSNTADGPDVTKGGARNKVSNRKLLYSPSPGGTLATLNWNSTDVPSNAFLGLGQNATSEQRAAVLSELQRMWGDPLHSVPVMVNYGGTADNNYVFVSTNGGMLHAINTSSGQEAFAFMPHEFITQAPRYTTQRLQLRGDNTRQTYGLDGSWVAWRSPGATVDAAPERVLLYGGMRRGGRNYYALNVTTPASPSMAWQINNGTEGYAGLGQTWSTPTLTQVRGTDGTKIPILVVGGGYSPDDHDGHKPLSAGDSMGNMVYFINAENGSVVWSAGGRNDAVEKVNDMKWAVPASIAVVDKDFDGVADHMYFGDLGGQVFRIDIKSDGDHSVSKIASLAGNNANPRRFFEAPAVAYVNEGTQEALYLVISSGYRAHPLDEATADGIFVIRDEKVFDGTTGSALTMANMTNVVTGTATSGDWYYLFEDEGGTSGEKAMSSPVVYDGRILQSTYAPTAQDQDDNPCAVRYGEAFLHMIDLKSGAPRALTDTEAPESRRRSLQQSTPPPTPSLLINEEGELIVIIGTEPVDEGDPILSHLRRHRWMQLPPDEANAIRSGATQEEPDEEDAP